MPTPRITVSLASLAQQWPIAEFATHAYDGCAVLDALLDFRLFWRFNLTDMTVELATLVKNTGWFSIGFSSDGTRTRYELNFLLKTESFVGREK